MARFSAQLALRPHLPLGHAAVPAVRRLHAAAGPQRDARPDREAHPSFGEHELRSDRARRGPRGPVLRPIVRAEGQVPGVQPPVIAVPGAHAQPVAAPLQHGERLAVEALAHPRRAQRRLTQQRREGGGHHRRRVATDGFIGEQAHLFPESRVRREAAQRLQRVAARHAAGEPLPGDLDVEDAEAVVRHPATPQVVEIAFEPPRAAAHRRSPRPGTPAEPRA